MTAGGNEQAKIGDEPRSIRLRPAHLPSPSHLILSHDAQPGSQAPATNYPGRCISYPQTFRRFFDAQTFTLNGRNGTHKH